MEIDTKILWQEVCGELAVVLSEAIFKSWIGPCYIEDVVPINEERVIVEMATPTAFHSKTIDERYYSDIKKVLEKHLGKKCELAMKVREKPAEKGESKTKIEEGLFTTGKPLGQAVNATGLNPRFTLGSFVVGGANNLAFAAARSVVENPGTRHNPFFIWGGVGVGKTHLMQAVGWELAKKGVGKVVYVSSEQFTNELIQSLRTHTTDTFKKRYRQVGALLVDDIQFFAGKESSQEEFFHTFNELNMRGAQIILTSDKKPQEISQVEERLVSRFLGGMTVDIGLPDFEMRCAILQQKAAQLAVTMEDNVIEAMATKMVTNARELEGAITRLVTAAAAEGREIDGDLVEKIVGIKKETEKKKVRPVTVMGKVARQFNLRNKDLAGKSRKAELVKARHIAMFLLNHDLELTLVEIGKLLGGRDHTTVMHGVNKIKNDFDINQELREQVMRIRREVFL